MSGVSALVHGVCPLVSVLFTLSHVSPLSPSYFLSPLYSFPLSSLFLPSLSPPSLSPLFLSPLSFTLSVLLLSLLLPLLARVLFFLWLLVFYSRLREKMGLPQCSWRLRRRNCEFLPPCVCVHPTYCEYVSTNQCRCAPIAATDCLNWSFIILAHSVT